MMRYILVIILKYSCSGRVLSNANLAWCLFLFSVDNSEYMRNGDFLPTRLQAQQDAVNIVCHSKTRSNPENNVGLITMAKLVDLINHHTFI